MVILLSALWLSLRTFFVVLLDLRMASPGRSRGTKDLSVSEKRIICSVYDFFVDEKHPVLLD